MTESELLTALEELSVPVPPERNGMCTTEEVGRALAKKLNISEDAAIRRVRKMWKAAMEAGRLDWGRAKVRTIQGMKSVQAYKLKDA